MKKIAYLLIWVGIIGIVACEDVEVGYLVTDEAAYQKDSLSLYNVQERLQELVAVQDEFNERIKPLVEKRKEWESKREEKQMEMWGLDAQIYELKNQLDATTDPAEREEIQESLDVLNEQRNDVWKEWQDCGNQIWYIRKDIEKIADEMRIGSEAELNNKVSKLKNTIKYKIPWVTPLMESVFGTKPLIYSIAGVKNENPANAGLFRKSLSIIGGGRMYVEQNVEAPPGRYIVSIRIENEGKSAVLEDVFTFIIEEME